MAPDYRQDLTYAQTRLPMDQASTLIPDAYRSSEFHDIERQRVFAGGWVAVGYLEQLRFPGDTIQVDVADQPIMVTRATEGLRGYHNVCRHRAAKLVESDCNLKRFRCRYHSWTYSLEGRLLGAPLFEGSGIPDDQRAVFDTKHVAGFDPDEMGLLPVRVDHWGHLAFVNLDGMAPPLPEWLGDLPERLAGYRLDESVIVGRRPYEIAANWKLIAENFMEYYHLPWVHPELAKVSRVEDHYRFQGPGMYTGMCTTPVTQDENSGWSSLEPPPGLGGDDRGSGRFIYLFPNVALSVLPNHVFTMILRPRGPHATLEETALALNPTTASTPDVEKAIAKLLAFWHHVNSEDIDIVAAVQDGIASQAYTGGRMCYRFEEPLHRFQNMVADRMVGIHRIPPGDEHPDQRVFDTAARQRPAAR